MRPSQQAPRILPSFMVSRVSYAFGALIAARFVHRHSNPMPVVLIITIIYCGNYLANPATCPMLRSSLLLLLLLLLCGSQVNPCLVIVSYLRICAVR